MNGPQTLLAVVGALAGSGLSVTIAYCLGAFFIRQGLKNWRDR